MHKPKQKDPQLAHCARCKRLYVRFEWNVCETCLGAEEGDHGRIREELSRTPDVSIETLAERAQVTVACVLRMLDEGLIASADAADRTCGQCGAPAISAKQRLCARCLLDFDQRVSRELHQAQKHRQGMNAMKGRAGGVLSMLKTKRRRA
jgi:hypothetical protein